MQITLKFDRNQFIEVKVKSGNSSSVDEVIAVVLELLADRSQHPQSVIKNWLSKLVQKIRRRLKETVGEFVGGITPHPETEYLRSPFVVDSYMVN